MSFFDIIVPFIVGCSSILGFTRGFINEFMRLAVWLFSSMSTYMCVQYYPPVFHGIISDEQIAKFLSAFVLFVFFFLLFKIFHYFLTSVAKATKLKSIDKSLGFGFGLLRGVVISAGFFCLAGLALPQNLQARVSSDFLYWVSCVCLDAAPQKGRDAAYNFLKAHHPRFSQSAPSKEETFKKFANMQPNPKLDKKVLEDPKRDLKEMVRTYKNK